jgi:hypothetical protein
MLQAGKSRIRFPMRSLDFSINPSSRIMVLVSTQPLEMSTRNLHGSGDKGWPVRKFEYLTAICEPIF